MTMEFVRWPRCNHRWVLPLWVISVALICTLIFSAPIFSLGHCQNFERGNCLLAQGGGTDRSIFFDIEPYGTLTARGVSSLGVQFLGSSSRDVVLTVAYPSSPITVTSMTNMVATFMPSWTQFSKFLPLFLVLIATVGLLQVLIIRYALRPTNKILEGLNCLERGDLAYRLPHFRLSAFHRIGEAFNRLATDLGQTIRHKDILTARLIDRLEQERMHLARELHDELAQKSAGMSAIIESIRATAEIECPTLSQDANRLLQISLSMQKNIGATLSNLRLSQIDDLGLQASLFDLVKAQECCAGRRLSISLEICGNVREIPRHAAVHIYRVVQEGLTNISKHANADQARIRLKYHTTSAGNTAWLIMMIEDNGSAQPKLQTSVGAGLGLMGIDERVRALGGRVRLSTNLQTGFRILALIPFHS